MLKAPLEMGSSRNSGLLVGVMLSTAKRNSLQNNSDSSCVESNTVYIIYAVKTPEACCLRDFKGLHSQNLLEGCVKYLCVVLPPTVVVQWLQKESVLDLSFLCTRSLCS